MIPDSDIEVRKSRIAGLGIFALRSFEPGEVVFSWKDVSSPLTDEEYERLPLDQRMYVARYNGGWLYMMPPARYINHSCEANTNPIDGADVVITGIASGEEITSDYRSELKDGEKMECHCGTPSCKGYIIGTAI